MVKRLLTLSLAALLFQPLALTQSVAAGTKAEKIKSSILKLGTGTDVRVNVGLRGKQKLSGYLAAVGDDSFTIVDVKTGVATEVPYPGVTQIKGHNLSTGAKIAIGVGIGVGVVLLVIYLVGLQLD